MNEIVLCEKCGEQMQNTKGERTTGMVCPKCSWGWVTTFFEPIETDDTDYSIFVKAGNTAVIGNIKLIADIAGINFIQAKKLLTSGNDELIYKATDESASTMCKAQRVQLIARQLKEVGITFTITPDFPFEV